MPLDNTEPVPTTSEIVESLKVELQLNHLQGLWLEKKLERICASEQARAILNAETEMRLKFDASKHDFATLEWMFAQMNDYIGYLQTQLEGETHD